MYSEQARFVSRLRRCLDRALALAGAAASGLVLAVSVLLFLQWPLRDLVQAYSREANDLAQWMFALYVSVAVTYATRTDSHLAAHMISHRYSARLRRGLRRASALLVLLPWSSFMLYAAALPVWQSVRQLEAFPDTNNPGYFLIKIAGCLLALLVFLQALIEVLGDKSTYAD
jgi:TRAP-type mannitol/chloroaromatic compound transport system permease small subunit